MVSYNIFVEDIIMQLLSNKTISIDFVKSKDNLADLFTKGLSIERIDCTSREIDLKLKE